MRIADVQLTARGSAIVARLTGEIDLSNAQNVGNAIAEAVPNSAAALVLDLTEVSYLDSAGIHLIYQLRERLRNRGQGLRLVVPSDSPAGDALRLSGVSRHVETIETLEQALEASG